MTFDQLNPAGAADCVINLVVDLDRDQPSALFCSSLVYQFFLPLFLLCLSVFISFVLTLSDSSNVPRETVWKDKRDNVVEHFSTSVTISSELHA